MATTFAELSFRDVVGKLVIAECPLLEQLAEAGISVPEGADAVLAYAYVDHEQGFSFFSLAPASFESKKVFHEASFPIAQEQTVILRSGSFSPELHIAYPNTTDEHDKRYSEQIEFVDKSYAPGPGVKAARAVEQADGLRSSEYPDDVFVILTSDDLPQEGVWFRLEALAGDDMLAGILLNEPEADYPVHEGDFMAIAFAEDEDGSPVLFTVPDLLIAHPEG